MIATTSLSQPPVMAGQSKPSNAAPGAGGAIAAILRAISSVLAVVRRRRARHREDANRESGDTRVAAGRNSSLP
jgi:hypothetical protein